MVARLTPDQKVACSIHVGAVRGMPVPEQMRYYDECYLCSSFQYSDILVVNKAWSLLPCCAELCKSSDLLAFFCRKNAGGS
ncbi:unnamed protein product [Sphagnum troendelagicum]|uniref:Uncharacterized protein n=1 Tax=Sphagnum troendelagicum TaxID=128251 RepID=A0ABP0V6W8_9BRYO